MTRALLALSLVAGAAGCPGLLPDPRELGDGINAQVLLAHPHPLDDVVVEVDGTARRQTAHGGDALLTFNFTLDVGDHPGRLTVLTVAHAVLHCPTFTLTIPDGADTGAIVDAAAFDEHTLPACDAGGEGEEGEGEGEGDGHGGEGEGDGGEGEGQAACVVGFHCDDGIACTHDDTCLRPGVCIGTFAPSESCGTCDAQLCSSTCAPCCVSATDDCESVCGTCLAPCQGQVCRCDASVCAQTNGTPDPMHAVCAGNAVCDESARQVPSATFECQSGASCAFGAHESGPTTITCDDSTCIAAADGGVSLDMRCSTGATCSLDAGAVSSSLTCEGASCSMQCASSGDCRMSCAADSQCFLDCSGADGNATCELACSSAVASCDLACSDGTQPCPPGETCNCDSRGS